MSVGETKPFTWEACFPFADNFKEKIQNQYRDRFDLESRKSKPTKQETHSFFYFPWIKKEPKKIGTRVTCYLTKMGLSNWVKNI